MEAERSSEILLSYHNILRCYKPEHLDLERFFSSLSQDRISGQIRFLPLGIEALSLGVKRTEREGAHSPPSSAEYKNAWNYTFTPPHVFMVWCLINHRETLHYIAYIFMSAEGHTKPSIYVPLE
jgi:hypothetical protein